MRRKNITTLIIILLLSMFSITVFAEDIGDGNIDGGGGGMGNGTSENFWNTDNEGVRVTVIRVSDKAIVTTPIDLTNKSPTNIGHFGKVCKLQYTNGTGLTPNMSNYTYVNPSQRLPKIISTSSGNSNIEAIKSYFTDEQVIRSIANLTGFNFNILINGNYKLLIEPIAYITFNSTKIAMTATESALYDEKLSGGLRSKMLSLSHQNLPLAMFLETPDLGYPAWSGSVTSAASNANIKSSLGLGIVKFDDETEPPVIGTYDYEYRVNTEVITAVTVSGGQSDPDNPVTVTFNIKGTNYTVENVYYPDGDSQLAWVNLINIHHHPQK